MNTNPFPDLTILCFRPPAFIREYSCSFVADILLEAHDRTASFYFTAPTIPASYNLRSMRRRFRSACNGMMRECGTTQKYSQTSHNSSSVVIQFTRSNRFKLTGRVE